MLLRITHETRLSYSTDVTGTIFEARMAPRSDEDQTTHSYKLASTPSAPITSYRDGDGNRIDLFNIFHPYRYLNVTTTSYVRTHRRDVDARLAGKTFDTADGTGMGLDLKEFLKPSPLVPCGQRLTEFARSLNWPTRESACVRARRLLDALSERLRYEPEVTHAWSSVEDVLALNRGVCQDFAHVLIGLARLKGMPARYVSGYIHQPGQIATHAWAQIWFGPDVGWIDLDPTRGGFADDDHVTVALGRDYSDVPPNRGLWMGDASETIEVAVEIQPVDGVPADLADFGMRKQFSQSQNRRFSWGRHMVSATGAAASSTLTSQPFQPTNHPQQTQQQQEFLKLSRLCSTG